MFFLGGFISGSVNLEMITWQPIYFGGVRFLDDRSGSLFFEASLSRTMLVFSHLVIYGCNLQGFASTDLHHVICRHYKKAAR